MANKNVFKSAPKGKTVAPADTTNRAGGAAYSLGTRAAIAQYAATGTFNDTFYSSGEEQIDELLGLLPQVDPEFIGKVAVYSREQGRMKDMPALLCAHLSTRGEQGMAILKRVFPFVLDNGKMLRNFVQIIRSGKVGRKSLGSAPKKLGASWFSSKQPADIFKMSVGNDPSIGDVIHLTHPPDLGSPERKALYEYLGGGNRYDFDSLPPLVKEYENFKKDPSAWTTSMPKVPFEMLMGLKLSDKQWKELALNASWTQLRMNLNTFARHGVFKDESVTKQLADKLANAELIEKAKPFPYQLFTAYLFTQTTGDEAIPQRMRTALHQALELATKSVITYEGQAHIAVDTSGSMSGNPVTGSRTGATTKMSCVDVAALIACTFLRKNTETKVYPFDTRIHSHNLDPHDSIMTNADKLRKYGGGGTDCGLVLAHLNQVKAKGDLVIYASDNESWYNGSMFPGFRSSQGTVMAQHWEAYRVRNPKAKLVCIDLAVGATTQVPSDQSVLNIGGFSDTVWEVIKSFVEGRPSADHWVSVIEAVKLPEKA